MNEINSRDGLTKEEAAAFVGKNTEYYFEKWESRPDTFYKGWNWAAAAFRIEWMAYRKMYFEALVALVIVVVLGVSIDAILGFMNLDLPDGIARSAIQILIGALANGLYHKKAIRVLKKTNNMAASERLNYLAQKGGTNLVGLFVLLGLEIALVIIFPLMRYFFRS